MRKTEKQLKEEFRRWLYSDYAPVTGAEDDDDNKDTDADKDDTADADANADKDDDADADADADKDDDGDKAGDDAVARVQKENKDLKNQLAKAEHAAAEAKKRASKIEAEQAEKTGNFKQLAQQREAELQDTREEKAKAESERDEIRSQLDNFQKRVRVISIAQKLGYKDPEDAMAVLEAHERKLKAENKDEDLMGDDISCERALRKLSEEKKYLVDQKRRTGGPMNGNQGGQHLSAEQIKSMSPEEIISRKKEVDASMTILYGNSG